MLFNIKLGSEGLENVTAVVWGFLRSAMKALSVTLQILPLLMYSERAIYRQQASRVCSHRNAVSLFFILYRQFGQAVAKDPVLKNELTVNLSGIYF